MSSIDYLLDRSLIYAYRSRHVDLSAQWLFDNSSFVGTLEVKNVKKFQALSSKARSGRDCKDHHVCHHWIGFYSLKPLCTIVILTSFEGA